MPTSRAADRYGKALLDLAIERQETEKVLEDVHYVNDVIESSRELQLMLQSPIIRHDKKAAIFDRLFKHKIGETTYGFLALILKKKREKVIDQMLDFFIHRHNALQGITEIEVTTAVPIDDRLNAEIVAKLKAMGLNKVAAANKIDPAIMGGFIIEFDNNIIDASIKSKLANIGKNFLSKTFISN